MKLIIKSLKEGYRRAGFAFSSKNETVLNVADLEDDQIQQLKNDKRLTVVTSEADQQTEGQDQDEDSNTPENDKDQNTDDDTSGNDQTPNISKGAADLIKENDLDASQITGTGKNGQITKPDVTKFIEAQPAE